MLAKLNTVERPLHSSPSLRNKSESSLGILTLRYDVTDTDSLRYRSSYNPAFYQLDARIDKKYNFKKWNLNVFIDITNLTNVQLDDKPIFILDRDAAGNKQLDPNDPSKYKTKLLADKSGSLLSTIGIIIEI